jgi:hypothetical protein
VRSENAFAKTALSQPPAPPARRLNLAINGIRTLKQHADTADDLVLLGEGREG